MIKRLLSALGALIVMSGATPALAGSGYIVFWRPRETVPTGEMLGFKSWEQFLRWQGCDASIVVWEAPNVNAGYSSGQNKIMVMRGLINAVTPEMLAFVVAHEAGHCLQYKGKSPWLNPNNEGYSVGNATPYGYERDAEAHAVKIMRVLGYDGARIGWDLRVFFAQKDGRALDQDRGTHGSAVTMSEWGRDHDGLGREGIQVLFR